MATEQSKSSDAAIIIGIAQVLLREAPGAAVTLRALFNKENPTDADFEAAKEQIRQDTYEKLVPNSQVPTN